MLKPVDIIVLAELLLRYPDTSATQLELAQKLGLSQSTIHRAMSQLERSGLWQHERPQVLRIQELFEHALSSVYPASLGAPARGLGTAHSGPGLVDLTCADHRVIWVWENGPFMGMTDEALLPVVPQLAAEHPRFHGLLAFDGVFPVAGPLERALASQ